MSCCPHHSAEEYNIVGDAVLAKLSGFLQLLRKHEFVVGLRESRDAARVLALENMNDANRVRDGMKTLLCSRASDWKAFDALFDSHWMSKGLKKVMKFAGSAASSTKPALQQVAPENSEKGAASELADQIADEHGNEIEDGSTAKSEGASRGEVDATTDFRKIADPAELEKAHAAAERLAKLMRTKLTRRDRARNKGHRIDLRATIHRNISAGGIPINLKYRQRKQKPLRLVVMLDASGSMQMYTAVFTRFIHGVLDHFREAEAFVFHTRLAHISSAMKEKNATRALERMSLMTQGVGGGTRIGECLATFNKWHARRVLNSRSCLMIFSDGYDTGDPKTLSTELRRLRRRCRRIAWLNPMAGWDGYKPDAKAMQLAMPYLDLFAPAHNLKSLEALEPYLARL
jgi:uncharacterized protein with von Willebrand factor type A (vWA) domain